MSEPPNLNASRLRSDQRRLGRYLVEAEPAQSGLTAEVHRTVTPGAVVKRYKPSESSRAADEHAAFNRAGAKSHVVPAVLDTFTDEEGRPCLLLEDAGTDLGRLGRRSESEAVELTVSTLRALMRLHASGLCHGDVRPANVSLPGLREPTSETLDVERTTAVRLLDLDRAAPYTAEGAKQDLQNVAKGCLELLSGQPAVRLGKTYEEIARTFVKSSALRDVLLGALRDTYAGVPGKLSEDLKHFTRDAFQALPPHVVFASLRKTPAPSADRFEDTSA